jgi:hypothetical protein
MDPMESCIPVRRHAVDLAPPAGAAVASAAAVPARRALAARPSQSLQAAGAVSAWAGPARLVLESLATFGLLALMVLLAMV